MKTTKTECLGSTRRARGIAEAVWASTCFLAGAMVILLATGCVTEGYMVDRTAVQAQAGAPVSAQVEIASVPYDPNLPRYVVAVLPLNYGASGITSGSGREPSGNVQSLAVTPSDLAGGGGAASKEGIGVASQLTTALTRCGNISVVDPSMLIRNPDGTITCKLQPGEVGPLLIKGTLTEFNETVDASERERTGSLRQVGQAASLLGAVSGAPYATVPGDVLQIADPQWENKKVTRKGMVGMDLQLIDGRTGRIVRGYTCSGTFATQSAVNGKNIFGFGNRSSEFAASALGQATRAAMNEALRQTADALRVVPR